MSCCSSFQCKFCPQTLSSSCSIQSRVSCPPKACPSPCPPKVCSPPPPPPPPSPLQVRMALQPVQLSKQIESLAGFPERLKQILHRKQQILAAIAELEQHKFTPPQIDNSQQLQVRQDSYMQQQYLTKLLNEALSEKEQLQRYQQANQLQLVQQQSTYEQLCLAYEKLSAIKAMHVQELEVETQRLANLQQHRQRLASELDCASKNLPTNELSLNTLLEQNNQIHKVLLTYQFKNKKYFTDALRLTEQSKKLALLETTYRQRLESLAKAKEMLHSRVQQFREYLNNEQRIEAASQARCRVTMFLQEVKFREQRQKVLQKQRNDKRVLIAQLQKGQCCAEEQNMKLRKFLGMSEQQLRRWHCP